MKTTVVVFVTLLASLIVSCDDKEIENIELNGTYVGNFNRSSPVGDWKSANVTLKFENNSFVGESDIEKYPAICTGTFEIVGNEINFENECVWTAEFDWTFILSGKFEISTEENELVLTRRYDENTLDQYILTKQ